MKVAIIADNYKLPKFREALAKANIVVTGETPFVQKTTVMSLMISHNQLNEVKNICELLEINFNQSN